MFARSEEIEEALEAAAGPRIRTGSGALGGRQTVNKHDVDVTRRTILLFLESLDPDLTISELREHLET